MSKDESAALIRYGQNQAANRRMGLSTHSTALFFDSPISDIKRMAKAERMAARVKKPRGGQVTMTFDMEGLNDVLPKLRKACNW